MLDLTKMAVARGKILVQRESVYYEDRYTERTGLFVVTDDEHVDRTAPEIGVIVAVGPRDQQKDKQKNLVELPLDVAVGDRVLFSRYAGQDGHEIWGAWAVSGVPGDFVFVGHHELLAKVE